MKTVKKITLVTCYLSLATSLLSLIPTYAIELPDSPTTPDKFTSAGLIGQLVSVILPSIFGIAGFITAIMIVISGIQFVTSKSDPKAAEAAKGRLTYAIIGFIVILLSFAILQTINFLFLKSGVV